MGINVLKWEVSELAVEFEVPGRRVVFFGQQNNQVCV